MTTPETPKNTPATVPSASPSDELVKNFRATLDTRWSEFDAATMKEAQAQADANILGAFANVKERRDMDKDFLKAKKTFDEAKSMLADVQDDAELKKDQKILAKVEESLKGITTYLADLKPEEMRKAHVFILAHTRGDLADFKAKITGRVEDAKEAEKAYAEERAMPRPSLAAAATAGAGLSLISDAEASEMKGEIGGEIKKALGPWGMIFRGVEGVSAKEVATQVKDIAKEYREKKWTEDPFDKFLSMIQLFLLKWQIGRSGLDLSGEMTEEEMKMAGLPPIKKTVAEEATTRPDSRYGSSALFFETVFVKGKNLPVRNILQDTSEKSIRNMPIGELKSVYSNKQYDKLLNQIGLEPQRAENKAALEAILEGLFEPNKEKFIREAYLGGTKQAMDTSISQDLKLKDYFEGSYGILRRMSSAGKALATQGGTLVGRINLKNNEVSFDNETDESDALKLVDGDKKLLQFAFVTGGAYVYTRGDAKALDKLGNDEQFKRLYPEPKDKEKALGTMKKFFDFVESFYTAIETNENINLGMKNEISEILNKKSLKIRGLMMIYLSFGDKDMKNFDSFSTIEQAEIYGYVMSIFGTQDNFAKGKLTSQYLTALEESKKPIPKNVVAFATNVLGYATEKAWDTVWEGAKYFAGVAVDNPRLAAALLVMNVPFIPQRNSVAELMF